MLMIILWVPSWKGKGFGNSAVVTIQHERTK
jgi:hypothetical protein